MIMPKGAQPRPGLLARAVSAEVRAVMARHRVSRALLSERTGMSSTYLGRRLRDEVPFTIQDIDVICAATREDVAGLLIRALRTLPPRED